MGKPEQLGAADTRLLLEVMKSTAAAALAMSEPAQLGTTSAGDSPASTEQPGHVAAENKRFILEVLKATAEGARAVAETARIGAAITEKEGDRQWGGNDRHTAAAIQPEEPLVKIPPIVAGRGSIPGDGPFVINERVGTITVAAWEGLSAEKLKEIDDGLKGIAKNVCGGTSGWGTVASKIQEGLAALGLHFAPFKYFQTGETTLHCARSGKTELCDLTRVLAMGDYYRVSGFGTNDNTWYVDEMIRVLQKLMELRGFKI